jgi:hypothetical protein
MSQRSLVIASQMKKAAVEGVIAALQAIDSRGE